MDAGPTYSMQVIKQANMTLVRMDAKLCINIFPHASCDYSFEFESATPLMLLYLYHYCIRLLYYNKSQNFTLGHFQQFFHT